MFFIEKSLDIRYFFEGRILFISTRLYICLSLSIGLCPLIYSQFNSPQS